MIPPPPHFPVHERKERKHHFFILYIYLFKRAKIVHTFITFFITLLYKTAFKNSIDLPPWRHLNHRFVGDALLCSFMYTRMVRVD